MRGMENRSRLVVIALVAVLAVAGGFAAGAFLTGNRETPTATPTDVAEVTDEPTDIESESPTRRVDGARERVRGADRRVAVRRCVRLGGARPDRDDHVPGRSCSMPRTTPTAPTASSRGRARRAASRREVTSVTPMGDLEMCLSTPDKELGCRTAGSGTLSAKTTKSRETFILTLRGEGTAQPSVDVTLTFPARKPKVSIDNARFDGTAYPDTNGIQAVFTPRQNGDVRVIAEWGGHPFTYEIDLIEQGGTGSLTYAPEQGNIGTDVKFAVTAPNPWKLVLQNTETGFGITPMNASISWP